MSSSELRNYCRKSSEEFHGLSPVNSSVFKDEALLDEHWGSAWGYLILKEKDVDVCVNYPHYPDEVCRSTCIHSRPIFQTNVFRNKQSSYVVGRGITCDIQIDKPSVSCRHFQIDKCTSDDSSITRIYITDMSLNGSYINGKKIGKGNSVVLFSEDVINIPLETRDTFIKYVFYGIPNAMEHRWPLEAKYELLQEIGVGAFSVVWVAKNRATREMFAVKCISRKKYTLNNGNRDFTLEARILKELNHKNIVNFKEYVETDTNLYIVMELVRGTTLWKLVKERGSIEVNQIRSIVTQMMEAVQFLNSNSIVHRDLKPDNFMLTFDGLLKLIDFGFASPMYSLSSPKICGNPGFVAPEVLSNSISYDDKVDSYSLGATIYFMICGTPPEFEKAKSSHKYSVLWPRGINISNQLKDLVSLLLMYNPEKRFLVSQAISHPWMKIFFELDSNQSSTRSNFGSQINISGDPWLVLMPLNSTSKTNYLFRNPAWLGRFNTCDVVMKELTVSGYNCQFYLHSNTDVCICDFGLNGIRINGILLQKYVRRNDISRKCVQ